MDEHKRGVCAEENMTTLTVPICSDCTAQFEALSSGPEVVRIVVPSILSVVVLVAAIAILIYVRRRIIPNKG